jgi:hypothetical protein
LFFADHIFGPDRAAPLDQLPLTDDVLPGLTEWSASRWVAPVIGGEPWGTRG